MYTPETRATGASVANKPDKDAGGVLVDELIIARCSLRNCEG